MDISSITNSYDNLYKANLNKQQSEVESFQSVLEKASADRDDKKLKEACKEFETYFLNTMLKEMRKTVSFGSSFVPKSQAESMFEGMLDEEYAKNMAEVGGIGLADMMYKQMNAQNAD